MSHQDISSSRNASWLRGGRSSFEALALALLLGSVGPGFAAPSDPGRLFFTPEQRAQLEAARVRNTQPGAGRQVSPDGASGPLRYDGVLIRSDGKTTRWVDGKARLDGAAVSGLKPGQVRAGGRVYEPYQILRPQAPGPVEAGAKESTP